jgi:hypothetical protein
MISPRFVFTTISIIYCVSLTILVPASIFITKPVLIGNILLLISISMRINNLTVKPDFVWRGKYFIIIVVYLVLFCLLRLNSSHSFRTLLSLINLMVLAILFIILLSLLKEYEVHNLIKTHILLTTIISFASLISWIIVEFEYVHGTNFLFSLYDASDGKYTRDSHLKNGGYTAPYFIGLVLTSSYEYTINGFSYYRASGWSHEPSSGAFFVMPSIILLFANKDLFKNATKYMFILINMCAWLTYSSVGSLLAIMILLLFSLFISFVRKGINLTNFANLLFIITIFVLSITIFKDSLTSFDLFKEKFSGESKPFILINRILLMDLNEITLGNILLKVYVILCASISISGIVRGGESAAYGYAFLYILIFGVKGHWSHTSAYIFTLFFFYLLVYYQYKSWNISSIRNQRPMIK